MTEHDKLAEARYFREGDGRIRDREWGQSGYVLKVWAMRDDGGGLTDVGPEVEAELSRLLVLLNGHAAALAAARAQGAQEAARRLAAATGRTFIPAERCTDIDVVEDAIRALAREAAKEDRS